MITLTVSYLFSTEHGAENVRLSHCIDEMRKKTQMRIHALKRCGVPSLCTVVFLLPQE